MKLHVEVRQDHIDKGKHSACDCPVALAIDEALGIEPSTTRLIYKVRVTKRYIMLPPHAAIYPSPLSSPPIVQSFVQTFDNGLGPVSPFEFDMEVPDVYHSAVQPPRLLG